MTTIVALVFCLLLGVMLRAQGISALLWVPLGFILGLFSTAQMILPVIMGLPRAVRLVFKGEMRPAILGSIMIAPITWFALFGAFGWFWPSLADKMINNSAFDLGGWLGTIAILLTPLSKKGRLDFREDFDNSYSRFKTNIDYKSSDKKLIIECGNCHKNLRIPDVQKTLKVTCPLCKHEFVVGPAKI